ncbi:MAG: thioredoxin family protein [Elusimicrobiota bacterium]
MKIEIFGPGCAKCNSLEKQVKDAVKELNIDAEVVKVSDINAMVSRGVMLTPALFIGGKKKSEGRAPNYEEIKKYLKEA